MALTKSDVSNWVSKCKQKALASIRDAHIAELVIAGEANPVIKGMLKMSENYTEAGKALQALLKLNGCENTSVYTAVSIYEYNGYNANGNSYVQAIGFLIWKNPEKFPVEHVLCQNYVVKYKSVESEYGTLYNKCQALKPLKAAEYLESLGFDISTLTPVEKKLDPAKLFVCGDNKPV